MQPERRARPARRCQRRVPHLPRAICARVIGDDGEAIVGVFLELGEGDPASRVGRRVEGSLIVQRTKELREDVGRIDTGDGCAVGGLLAFPATSLKIRVQDGDVVEVPAHRATHDLLRSALPFRTFRWYYGQRHYSGSYWSATMSAHVIYESRLELSRLLMADFDRSVRFIVAQPFLIRSKV